MEPMLQGTKENPEAAGIEEPLKDKAVSADSWGVPEDRPCEMLDPYDGKLSRRVLKGERGREASALTVGIEI